MRLHPIGNSCIVGCREPQRCCATRSRQIAEVAAALSSNIGAVAQQPCLACGSHCKGSREPHVYWESEVGRARLFDLFVCFRKRQTFKALAAFGFFNCWLAVFREKLFSDQVPDRGEPIDMHVCCCCCFVFSFCCTSSYRDPWICWFPRLSRRGNLWDLSFYCCLRGFPSMCNCILVPAYIESNNF